MEHIRTLPRAICLFVLSVLAAFPVVAQDLNGELNSGPTHKRVVVAIVGASVTYGVDMRAESARQMGMAVPDQKSATVPLRKVLSACWDNGAGLEMYDVSDLMFFAISDSGRIDLFNRAKANDPDLLVALDFLFWYGYGPLEGKGGAGGDTPEAQAEAEKTARLAHLEQGLALLKTFTGNLLIGNFPDMSAANRLVLNPRWRPDAETLKALNARVTTFAKERANTILFPLAEQVADLQTRRRTIQLGEHAYDVGRDQLFQFDRLHPNRVGMAVLGEALLTTLGEHKALPAILRPTPTPAARLIEALEATDQLKKAKLVQVPSEAGEKAGTAETEKVR